MIPESSICDKATIENGGEKMKLFTGQSKQCELSSLANSVADGNYRLTDWLTHWLYLHNQTLQINSEIENYNVQNRKEWTH